MHISRKKKQNKTVVILIGIKNLLLKNIDIGGKIEQENDFINVFWI